VTLGSPETTTGGDVVIALESHRHHGDRCRLSIHLVLPEHEIVVNDAPRQERNSENATAKTDRAFSVTDGPFLGRSIPEPKK
jgi:hypothetical protein